VKLGKPEIGTKAIAQASEYARRLKTNNIIVLIYPEKYKNQEILDYSRVNKLALEVEVNATILTDYWTESLTDTPINIFQNLKRRLLSKKRKIDFNSVINLIKSYVQDLNSIIYQIRTDKLISEVVNKLDLFTSVGELKDKEKAKNQVVNLASYLLFNQLLFYHIFRERTQSNIPKLEHVKRVKDIQKYFDKITDIDYQSIYRVDILGHIPDRSEVIDGLNDLIDGIKLLRAEHITHDLAGRFFHDLIPFEVRKIFAAFYTNPISAEILAGLTIDSYDETVIDPACGSGTLLVASYQRKKELYKQLYGYKDLDKLHKQFIEKDITGIDIMPFASHMTTINLTTQNIEEETNVVRIATADSLSLATSLKTEEFKKKGIKISPYTETIQQDLNGLISKKLKQEGGLSPEGKGTEFYLKPVDVVIMNPPFSDREKLPKEMREKLNKNQVLGSICGHQINLWGYFLALADLLLKPNGKIGAVLPINLARGKATEKIRNYLLENYHIEYIIKPTKDIAFSESAAFRDILFIAKKRKPKKTDITKIVFLKKSVKDIKEDSIKNILECNKEFVKINEIKYKELINYRDNFMPLLMPKEFLSLLKIFIKSNKLVDFDINQIDIGLPYRPKGVADGVFITRPSDESRIKNTKIIILEEKQNYIGVRIKNIPKNQFFYKFKRDYLKPALRTTTGIRKLAISKKEVDYILVKKDEKYWKSLRSYGLEIPSLFPLKNHFKQNIIIEGTYIVIPDKINLVSPNTCFISIFSENLLDCVGSTLWYVKGLQKKNAKIINLYFNSMVSLLQIVLLKSETLGTYSRLLKNDWQQFKILDIQKLTQKEKRTLLNLFEKLKDIEFPSILEQLENRFWARVELDKTILKILGFTNKEINEWLPKVYDALVEELKSMREVK